jgi:hypothetical protein
MANQDTIRKLFLRQYCGVAAGDGRTTVVRIGVLDGLRQ